MTDKITQDEYLKDFVGKQTADDRQKAALKQALDIRKFEIERYWKRAAYFWTFIGAAFAAYFILPRMGDTHALEPTYAVTCLGFLFSLAWYFVNRGSKAWQQNWEMHVDLLEDAVMGPLYKTVLKPHDYKFWLPTVAYSFSVSKINQILSLVITAFWLLFMLRTLAEFPLCDLSRSWVAAVVTFLTAAGVVLLCWEGQTDRSKQLRSVHAILREYRKS